MAIFTMFWGTPVFLVPNLRIVGIANHIWLKSLEVWLQEESITKYVTWSRKKHQAGFKERRLLSAFYWKRALKYFPTKL